MEISVNIHDWLSLPMQTRVRMREIFKIPRSSHTLVEGNVVKSDGMTYEDLKAITIEKMREYLNADPEQTDFVKLFNACVEKIQELDKELEPEKVDPTQVILQSWTSQLSQIVGQAKTMDMEPHLRELISKLLPNEQRPNAKPERAGKKAK